MNHESNISKLWELHELVCTTFLTALQTTEPEKLSTSLVKVMTQFLKDNNVTSDNVPSFGAINSDELPFDSDGNPTRPSKKHELN